MRFVSYLLGLLACAGCVNDGMFSCLEDTDCGAGICQPDTGYCSFADDDCASGQRYGKGAAGGLEGRCVPQSDDEDGVEPMAVPGTSSTSSAGTGSTTDPDSEAASGDPSPDEDDDATGSGRARCGDGELDPSEEREPALLTQTCEGLGYEGGILLCGVDCTYDVQHCQWCGNGVVEDGELCDGPLQGIGCVGVHTSVVLPNWTPTHSRSAEAMRMTREWVSSPVRGSMETTSEPGRSDSIPTAPSGVITRPPSAIHETSGSASAEQPSSSKAATAAPPFLTSCVAICRSVSQSPRTITVAPERVLGSESRRRGDGARRSS